MKDRNFDDLLDRFEHHIHSGFKGQLRRAIILRDLEQCDLGPHNQPMQNILDIGGGLGYFTTVFAREGHQVSFNELSLKMLQKTQANVIDKPSSIDKEWQDNIQWFHGAYQDLQPKKKYDLILCHAVIEWLEHPQQLLPTLKHWLKPGAYLSLCFYNIDGLIYHNLIRGNFQYLKKFGALSQNILQTNTENNTSTDANSLTPSNPPPATVIYHWLKEQGFEIESRSGIRVYSDYVLEKRGGNCLPDEVMAMEMAYSVKEPYKHLGRYIHVITKYLG